MIREAIRKQEMFAPNPGRWGFIQEKRNKGVNIMNRYLKLWKYLETEHKYKIVLRTKLQRSERGAVTRNPKRRGSSREQRVVISTEKCRKVVRGCSTPVAYLHFISTFHTWLFLACCHCTLRSRVLVLCLVSLTCISQIVCYKCVSVRHLGNKSVTGGTKQMTLKISLLLFLSDT